MSTKDLSRESFQTSRKFYDDKNYPRGLSRSGDYSINEVKLLEQYGVALSALSAGTQEPVTEDEIQFQQVCTGEKEAETSIEKAWIKYQTKTLTKKQFHTLFGRSKVTTDDASDSANALESDITDIDE